MQKLIAFIKANLAPNRIAIYVTAVVNITGAVVTLLSDLGVDDTAGVVAALIGINALAIKFLAGCQKYEAANYQADLINLQYRNEQAAREQATLSQAVGKPRVNLPR